MVLTRVAVSAFAQTLTDFPLDSSLIAEAVYAHSKTMNGQHFAAEFIRRKKLADKGVVEKQAADVPAQAGNTGGWSEVAKKSTHKEPSSGGETPLPAGFKVVVSGRKKGGKK